MKIPLKYIFFSEVIINIPSFIMCLFTPSIFIDQIAGMDSDILTQDIVRWYGVVLLVLTIILGKALYEKDISALKTIFTGYGIGDLIQIVVTAILASHIGGWNFSLIFTAAYSLLLFSARMMSIQKPERLGF